MYNIQQCYEGLISWNKLVVICYQYSLHSCFVMVIVLSLLGTLTCSLDTPYSDFCGYLIAVSAASTGMVSFEIPPRCRSQVRLKLYTTHIYVVLPNPWNWNAAWKPLVVQLQAAKSRKLYPLSTTWPSSALLWWHVFSVQFCDIMLVLFCDSTDQLKWLMWRSNGFASNSASNLSRWLQNHNRKCGRIWHWRHGV